MGEWAGRGQASASACAAASRPESPGRQVPLPGTCWTDLDGKGLFSRVPSPFIPQLLFPHLGAPGQGLGLIYPQFWGWGIWVH